MAHATTITVTVPLEAHNDLLGQFNEEYSDAKQRELMASDYRNSAFEQWILENCLLPFMKVELGYSENAEINIHGGFVEGQSRNSDGTFGPSQG